MLHIPAASRPIVRGQSVHGGLAEASWACAVQNRHAAIGYLEEGGSIGSMRPA